MVRRRKLIPADEIDHHEVVTKPRRREPSGAAGDVSGVTPAPASSTAASRLAWLDVAKGACILLVVLHHVVAKYLEHVLPPDLVWVAEPWQGLSTALKPLRMPVFFVISGFFAAGAIHRPWRLVVRRVTSPYYLYVVWLLVYFVIYRIETQTEANRTDDLPDLLGELLWAETSMWFLYALGVYFLFAKLLTPLPAPVVLGAATALALWSGWSGIDHNNKLSVLSHFAFFVLGSYFPQAVRRCGDLSGPVLWRLAGAYAATFAGLQSTGLPWSVTLVVASITGLPLGLGVMAKVAGTPRVGPALAWMGQRTLRVYVLHFAVILAVFHSPLMITATGLGGLLVAALLPVVATAVVTATCLFVYELMVVHGCQHLFRMHPVLEAAHDTLAALPVPPAGRVPPGQPGAAAKASNVPRDARSKPRG